MSKVSYSEIFDRAFMANYDGSSDTTTVSLSDLYIAAAAIGNERGLTEEERSRIISNMPDAAYYLRSRAKSMPPTIASFGFTTLEIVGSGIYMLSRGINEVVIPNDIETRLISTTHVPQVLMDTVGTDEQALLNMLVQAGVFDDFLGASCYQNQGHMRTTGTAGQQVEADFVLSCEGSGQFLVAVEGKGVNEKVGYSQMRPTIAAVKIKHPDYDVVALAAKMEADRSVLIMQFDYELGDDASQIESIELGRVVRYVLDPAPRLWS